MQQQKQHAMKISLFDFPAIRMRSQRLLSNESFDCFSGLKVCALHENSVHALVSVIQNPARQIRK